MRPTLRATATLALVIVLVSAVMPPSALSAGSPATLGIPPDNSRIAVFADPAGTQTCATIPVGSNGTLYLFADLAGETADGFTGAEFRVQVTHPEGYFLIFNPPSAAVIAIGNVFDTTPEMPADGSGINIAFQSCQTGLRVPMGTITVINAGGGATDMLVQRRTPPTNWEWPCPLFTRCDAPQFSKSCMGPCGTDAFGGWIVSRLSLNDPACVGPAPCATDCVVPPCVDLAAPSLVRACDGEPVLVQATATNCSSSPEDIDIVFEYAVVQTFTNVQPGDSVSVSQPVTLSCSTTGNRYVQFGAVARNATCPEPFGDERFVNVFCDARVCGGNQPPDCSGAHASVEELWPHNGKFVPVSIEGVFDPNGDPVEITINSVTSDEPPGDYGRKDCPDVINDGPNAVQLRAEVDPHGNGRVYMIRYTAREPSGFSCSGKVPVCVPQNRHTACVDDGQDYNARFCGYILPGRGDLNDALQIVPEPGGATSISFAAAQASDIRLDVYDIRGRLVRTVEQGRFPAGSHVLRWDGLDTLGRQAAAGVYLFRLRIDDRTLTAKSILIR
jgi:FlgD Ig-like domain